MEKRKATKDVDDDIVAGDEVVQLLDPFSRCRITIPVRGKNCKHTQCFDAFTYLQINKSSPKLECPICYSKLPLSQIVKDGLFEEILRDTSDDVEQVNVALDGTWSLVKQKDIFDVGASYMGEASASASKSRNSTNVLSSDVVVILGDSPLKSKFHYILLLIYFRKK